MATIHVDDKKYSIIKLNSTLIDFGNNCGLSYNLGYFYLDRASGASGGVRVIILSLLKR